MLDTIKGWISDALQWLLDALLWIPKKLWAELLDGFASAVESIPVPDFMANASSFFQGIPPGIVFFLDFFAVGEGLAMVISALVLRFVLRALPFVW